MNQFCHYGQYQDKYSDLYDLQEQLAEAQSINPNSDAVKQLKSEIDSLNESIDKTTKAYFNLLSGGKGTDTGVEGTLSELDKTKQAANDTLYDLITEYNGLIESGKINNYSESSRADILKSFNELATEAGGTIEITAEGKIKFIPDTQSAEQAAQDAKNTAQKTIDNDPPKLKTGNVDLGNRPVIKNEDGSISTTRTEGEFFKDKNGQYQYIHFTPITPDGTVLDSNSVVNYFQDIIDKGQNVLDGDNKGLVLKVTTETPSGEDIEKLQTTGVKTPAMEAFLKQESQIDEIFHDIQEKIYSGNMSVKQAIAETEKEHKIKINVNAENAITNIESTEESIQAQIQKAMAVIDDADYSVTVNGIEVDVSDFTLDGGSIDRNALQQYLQQQAQNSDFVVPIKITYKPMSQTTGIGNAFSSWFSFLKNPITQTVQVQTSGEEQVQQLNQETSNLQNKSINVTANVGGLSDITSLSSTISGLKDKTITITSIFKPVGSLLGGGTQLNGNAHLFGNARAKFINSVFLS